ncbi:hypothetical protein [Euzebyella saccharophila]|uniref:Uncharacterized protein n=1 Tax=Euzebyella saccharophila TaxID=679664 RepID=A0ABV8JLS6_9FLAO|nr:hypothetical protein [Euzebyella saccharophila]
MIKIRGYYLGKGKTHDDWHAGICFKSQNYIILKFFEDGKVLKNNEWILLDRLEENLNKFLEDSLREMNLNKNRDKLTKSGWWVGGFREWEKLLELRFEFNDNAYLNNYTIVSSDLILDENLNEFHYKRTKIDLSYNS